MINRKLWSLIIITVILSSFLVTGMVIAQEKVKIKMSVWGMPWESQIYTKYAIPQFEKMHPNIEVEFVRFDDYWNQLLVKQAGNNPPDVMRDLDENYGEMRIRGALQPITEYVNDPKIGVNLDNYTSQGISAVKKNGEIWGLPQDFSPRTVLIYNKSKFDKENISYPNKNWNWDDLIAAAKKLTKGRRPMVQQYGFGWSSNSFVVSMMFAHGGKLWSDDGKKSVVNSPKNVEGIKFLQDLVYEYGVSPTYSENDPQEMKSLFESGKVAMYVTGGWEIPALRRDNPDLKFGVVPLPKGPEGPSTVVGQCIWTLNSKTKHPREAYLLLKYLSSEKALKEYWQRTWVAAPARVSLIKGKEFENIIGIPGHVPSIESQKKFKELVGFYRKLINSDNITFDQVNPFYASFNTYFEKAMENVFALKPGDVESALSKVEDETNKDMNKFYKK